MTEGDFPFRSFTMRAEGYDRAEVDGYVSELQAEIVELRRALDTATPASSGGDARLHDPEGAVTRTLAIAQETADRVMHDAQVDADRRRAEADEHATTVVTEADERAARMLSEMEAQAAEVREQGVAAARSAIQVERDKAMAELAHVRRVRDDLRTEAVDLKSALDRYRSQAREASDTLAAASSGPLMSLDLPDFVDDDVVLAGIVSTDDGDEDDESAAVELAAAPDYEPDFDEAEPQFEAAPIEDLDDIEDIEDIELETDEDASFADIDASLDIEPDDELADVIAIDGDMADFDADDIDDAPEFDEVSDAPSGGAFLAEVRAAAADDDDVSLAPEDEADGDNPDRFLSELRGLSLDDDDDGLDSEAADTFFDDD